VMSGRADDRPRNRCCGRRNDMVELTAHCSLLLLRVLIGMDGVVLVIKIIFPRVCCRCCLCLSTKIAADILPVNTPTKVILRKMTVKW
jgi:hypothetical protein